MLRMSLILLLLLVASALGTVSSNHRARKMFVDLEREQARMRELEIEWGQLQLEQSTWANHARVEQIARNRLHMKSPASGQVISIEPTKP
ncbi:MAG: cell division protein FtsL [Proteobacteria bacterium]|nr:cell division protein FtsL [Pseudomonadota bacterium]